jgi:hypothetical protein
MKTGIELYNGKLHLSTVSCDRFADMSLYPVTTESKNITLEVFREGGVGSGNVWVHQLIMDDQGNVKERLPLREICWIFCDEHGDDWVLDICGLAARPDKKATGPLKAEFVEFKVQWGE